MLLALRSLWESPQFTGTASFDQQAASWQAAALESFDATASFVQAPATWLAADSEIFNATATWDQAGATWAAVASLAFTATGSFDQAAAAWSAVVAETFDATATWDQSAATWDATGNQTSDRDFTASWFQTQSWDAAVTGPAAEIPAESLSGARISGPAKRYTIVPPPRAMRASFVQQPASWRAETDTYDPYALYLLTDEPVLIGAR
jgi:hypothetical protein